MFQTLVTIEHLTGMTALCNGTLKSEVREVFKKSKWKFKMAFAMKVGGVVTGLECHIPILKNDFF